MSKPPKNIPSELLAKYTLNGKIPVAYRYFSHNNLNNIIWSKEYIFHYITEFTRDKIMRNDIIGIKPVYGISASQMYCNAFDKYPIKGLDIAIIGSQTPWIEAICINYGAKSVTTVEYNPPKTDFKDIRIITYQQFSKEIEIYDVIVSYSSIEHSGLGRYGDSLEPDGDLQTMESIYKALKKAGRVYIGIPVGQDKVVWNAHRIYGSIRLPMLFKNFKILKWIGGDEKLFMHNTVNGEIQPIIIAIKKL